MEILKNTIVAHPATGRLTFQIPTLEIGGAGQTEIVPDNWVCKMHYNDVPASGNMSWCLYLTSVGWKANKNIICAAYITHLEKQHNKIFTKQEKNKIKKRYENEAKKHFRLVQANLHKEMVVVQNRLAEANQFGTPKSVKYWTRKLTDLQSFTV